MSSPTPPIRSLCWLLPLRRLRFADVHLAQGAAASEAFQKSVGWHPRCPAFNGRDRRPAPSCLAMTAAMARTQFRHCPYHVATSSRVVLSGLAQDQLREPLSSSGLLQRVGSSPSLAKDLAT